MRNIGCEDGEGQVRVLTHSRSLTVFEREVIWRAVDHECRFASCPAVCPTRGLVSRVSANLATFVTRYSQIEECPECPDSGTLRQAAPLDN
jgi:hypothetical protein